MLSGLARCLFVAGLPLIASCDKPGSAWQRAKGQPAPFEMDRSREAQARRLQVIDQLTREGLITRIDQPGILPHVWITPRFMSLDFESRRRYMKVVFCYFAAPDPRFGTRQGDVLVVMDSLTGTRIGRYTPTTGLARG